MAKGRFIMALLSLAAAVYLNNVWSPLALFFGPAQKPWPSPVNEGCDDSERTKLRLQEMKAVLREDPLSFDRINGTTWTPVNRSDHTIAVASDIIVRSDLGDDVGFCTFAMLCEDYAERGGFYDMAFGLLERLDKLPPEQAKWAEMKVWVALSDHSLTGTPNVADRDALNGGVEIAVKRLQANPEPRTLLWLGQLTLRYEIQMNLQGMLWHDVDNRRGAAAMAAGLAEELVRTMRIEDDLCSPLFVSCSCMNILIMHNKSYAAKFKQLGAPELAAKAAKQCEIPIEEFIMFSHTFGQVHPAGPTCAYSAQLF